MHNNLSKSAKTATYDMSPPFNVAKKTLYISSAEKLPLTAGTNESLLQKV